MFEELQEVGALKTAITTLTFYTDQTKTKLFCLTERPVPYTAAKTQILSYISEKYPGAQIDESVLKDCVTKASSKPRRIGMSRSPTEPTDEKLILLAKPFKVDERTGLRFLDNIEPEREVARIVPPKPGENGVDIFGQMIPCREPKNLNIKVGQGIRITETEKHKSLISKVYGYLHYSKDEIDVKEELVIDGDVTQAIGNIRFNNSLKINGNVGIGFVIKSDRGIVIQGDVFKDSELHANLGSITVSGAVTQCKVIAKNVVKVESCSGSYIAAEQVTIKQECLNCEIFCEEFEATRCAGGLISATRKVSVQEIGNDTGVKTVVVMTQSRENEKLVQEITLQLKQLGRAMQTIKLQLGPYEFKNPKDLPDELRERISAMKDKLEKLESASGVLRSRLKEILDSSREIYGEIIISKKAYDGCEFRFGDEELILKESIKGPVTIKLSDGRITV